MVRLSSPTLFRAARGASLALVFMASAGRAAAQESLIKRLRLDRLQVASLGASAGRIIPSQVDPTMVYGIAADYGQIAPSWRVSFSTSYWSSKYRDAVVRTFVDSLNKQLTGSGPGLQPSRITVYDVTIGADVRYVPTYSGELKPFFGVGVAAHVINAEGKLIQGTFVERSLDDIAAGLYVTTGVALRLLSHIGVEGSARGDLLSGFRSTQVRVGGTYFFGRVRGTTTPATATP